MNSNPSAGWTVERLQGRRLGGYRAGWGHRLAGTPPGAAALDGRSPGTSLDLDSPHCLPRSPPLVL